jgi:guanosine-3',5'-bis(diphosphate) 3'-pyrophosphohydrolase
MGFAMGNLVIQTIYQETILYAASHHALQNQTLPDSNISYAVLLGNVCMDILVAEQYTPRFALRIF